MSIISGLSLTPFEWTMSNEISGSLMEFVIRLCCTGPVDVAMFEESIIAALKHQPLLQANASIGPTHSSSHWRPASDRTPIIQWLAGDPAFGRAIMEDFHSIELENEIGFRFYGWQYQDGGQPQTEMRFVFQHACCDGKGAIDFIEHVLYQYRFLTEGQSEKASPCFDAKSILDRDHRTPHSYTLPNRIWRALVVRPKRAAKMLLARPLSLRSTCETDDAATGKPARQCSATLDRSATKKIGDYARTIGATTNLVLAQQLFHVIGNYLEQSVVESNGSSNNRSMRMLIPFSLRNETHQHMPAANCVSMAYLEADQNLLIQDGKENPQLLADLVQQLAFIRKWKLQYAWLESVKLYARLWPLLRRFKSNQKHNGKEANSRPIATTVFSNLGRVFARDELLPTCDGKIKIGSLQIETVHLVLPCNADLSINFSVNFYGDRLTLDVSYLPSQVTQETANGLLDLWQRRILDVANMGAA